MSTAGSLGKGLAAGLVAGLLAALFAFVFAEPVVDRAIALEEQRSAAAAHDPTHTPGDTSQADADVPPVSRDTQRRVGAPSGFLLIGVALGAVYGLLYVGLCRFAPQRDAWHRALALGAAVFVGLHLVPFLRYPADPPGVGDPATVGDRTAHYLAAVLLGLSAVVGAGVLLRELSRRGLRQPVRHVVTAVAFAVIVGAGYAVLPSSGEPPQVPADLLWDFRLRALGTLVVLWSALVAAFGLLADRASRQSGAGQPERVARQPA